MEIKLDNTTAVLQQFADEVVEAYKSGILQYDAITRGHHFLYDSVTANPVEVNGRNMTVSINLAEYWKYIEDGRQAYGEGWRGHRPPISSITEWIEWKPYIASTSTSAPGYAALTPDLQDISVNTETDGLAWAIATNIAKRGISPKPILKESIEQTMPHFKKLLQEALAKDMGENIGVLLGDLWSEVDLVKTDEGWKGKTITDVFVF